MGGDVSFDYRWNESIKKEKLADNDEFLNVILPVLRVLRVAKRM